MTIEEIERLERKFSSNGVSLKIKEEQYPFYIARFEVSGYGTYSVFINPIEMKDTIEYYLDDVLMMLKHQKTRRKHD